MKRITILLALVLAVAMTLPATAEVEEITAGGSIIVRGQIQESGTTSIATPIGSFNQSFNDDIPSDAWYSQRTRINVDATLSGGVRAFVELQSFDSWGDNLDDLDVTLAPGVSRTVGLEDTDLVSLYQAYIDMNDIADYPVMVRIGRQELVYGREWLIGNNDAGINYSGLSFDAIKVVYADEANAFQIDAWASKLAELNAPFDAPDVQDDDTDFYGIYGTYTGIENLTLDAYGLLVRNAIGPGDVDYLYTIGARAAGTWDVMGALPGLLDYNAEVAYQFGDTTVDGDYEAWAVDLMAGYTFTDVQWTPRIELAYTYLSGDDDATDTDTETFSRLFSDVHYGELNMGGTLDAAATNLHIFRVGASAVPVEKLTVSADLYYFLLAEDDFPGGFTFGVPQPVASPDDAVGIETDLVVSYDYTEDLNLRAGWAHFFADDAIEDSWGGGEDDDIDYLYVQAALTF